mmetsp:Transcript_4408/g.13359  ORF Transcript_4408/g.13359 Transcript_4408/m.13359 type:complete len:358 (-) Transcript_4408:175-1248(-)
MGFVASAAGLRRRGWRSSAMDARRPRLVERSVGMTLPSTFRARPMWEQVDNGAAMVVRPPNGVRPKCIAHFLGGLAVGAAPKLAYQELIEMLAESGVAVVTTPFNISFDYFDVLGIVLERYDRCMEQLGAEYTSGVPVIGVGHSLGALLHVIISSLFPLPTKDANVLISFNNRSAKDAIPGFDAISAAFKALGPETFSSETRDAIIDGILRQAVSAARTAPIFGEELGLTLHESISLVRQFRPLLVELAEGADEFNPSPNDVKTAAGLGYDVLRTLIIKFRVDNIDQSELAEEYLASRTDLQKLVLDGTHTTPLIRDPFNLKFSQPIEDAVDLVRMPLLAELRALHATIMDYLDSIL